MGISFFEEDVDVNEENILHKSPEILKILLRDRTTGRNIVWATKTYELLGKDFKSSETIKVKSITGKNSTIIRPRVEKLKYEQKERTKGKAEVFTPSWIVKKQTDIIEQEFKHLSLEDYITKTWLEITCGEAPYMVNRYDMITGKLIPLAQRFGFVDRKLRRINDEINDEEVWQSLVKKAYQSSYGYEFHGDSLLLARENLFCTFIDYYQEKFGKQPNINLQTEIAKIISYNVFQMDGVKYTVPLTEIISVNDKTLQLNLFGEVEKIEQDFALMMNGKLAKVKNWKQNKMIEFKSLQEVKKMKFDVIIGNPPYQKDANGAGRQATPLYNYFVEASKKMKAEYICMIIPSRWFSGGMGLSNFRQSMMDDRHLKSIVDYTNSKDCFPGISISGGVCYFLRDIHYSGNCKFTNITNNYEDTLIRPLNEFPVLVRYNKGVSIIHKVKNNMEQTIDTIMSSLMPYGLSTNYRGDSIQKSKNDLILHSSNSSTYIDRSVILKGKSTIDKYKILISKTSTEHAGEPAKDGKFKVIPSSIRVIGPKEVCTHSYFIMGEWDDKYIAENALLYMKTKFVRFLALLCISGFGLSKQVFTFVPIQDFTSDLDIDWSKSIAEIDQQLYKKYGLNEEEINFIETKVKEMS